MSGLYYSVEDFNSSSYDEQALKEVEEMRKNLMIDPCLSLIFFETFAVLPDHVDFVPALCHHANYLVYEKNQYVAFFIRIINGNMLEIIAQ